MSKQMQAVTFVYAKHICISTFQVLNIMGAKGDHSGFCCEEGFMAAGTDVEIDLDLWTKL